MGKSTSNITPIANAQRRAGIGAADRRKVAEKLSEVLEGVYSLLLRTQMVHWNVRGASFHGVHILTEQQYKTLFEAIDIIAERIESEDAVLEVLDLDVPYGQGHLFGAPRAIKESLMEETAPPRDFLLKQGRVA